MGHSGDPPVGVGHAFYPPDAAVGHQYTPLAGVAARVGQIYAIHHVVLVAVDVLIAQTARIVDLNHGVRTVLIACPVPGVLVDEIIDKTARDVGIDAVRLLVADGVLHTASGSAAGLATVGVLARAALLLNILTAVFSVHQVGYTRVHQGVYLLHASLYAVIVEVGPAHTRGRGSAADDAAQPVTDYGTADDSAKVFIVMVPLRLHILYL